MSLPQPAEHPPGRLAQLRRLPAGRVDVLAQVPAHTRRDRHRRALCGRRRVGRLAGDAADRRRSGEEPGRRLRRRGAHRDSDCSGAPGLGRWQRLRPGHPAATARREPRRPRRGQGLRGRRARAGRRGQHRRRRTHDTDGGREQRPGSVAQVRREGRERPGLDLHPDHATRSPASDGAATAPARRRGRVHGRAARPTAGATRSTTCSRWRRSSRRWCCCGRCCSWPVRSCCCWSPGLPCSSPGR